MKRSLDQNLPSRKASSKMSRHDLEVEETLHPTTNVFLVETVLRRLFKHIESVSKLKDLRRMCQLWDRVGTEELEERAFKGLVKPISLTFFNEVRREFQPIKASSLEMREFLDDTSSNPRLFRSFAIVFPSSLAILNLYKFRWFYTDYSPTFLELVIPNTIQFNQDKEGLLKELLRWAALTLRELVIRNIIAFVSDQNTSRKSFPDKSFNFPHLRKMNMKSCVKNGLFEALKIIFAKENLPETPSLTSLKLRYAYPLKLLDLISNPRWATLTMLEIKYDNDPLFQRLNPFTDGLLSLAQAGMTLKKLNFGLYLKKNYSVGEDLNFLGPFRDLSQFFASQAGSLEALKLTFHLILNMTIEEDQEKHLEIKIHLPIFERLHTLSLDLDTRVYINYIFSRNIFEYGSISQHFPALENLTINFVCTLDAIFGGSHEAEERLNLKRLVISRWPYEGYIYDGPHFDEYLGFVEALSCPQYALHDLRFLGNLEDTIKVLNIQEVNSELDLFRFKGLRRVVIEEDDKVKKPIWMKKSLKLIEHKGLYLGYFKKVAELGLDSIKFRGLEMLGKEKEFAQAFPFRVEFEEKPVDWFDKNFIDN